MATRDLIPIRCLLQELHQHSLIHFPNDAFLNTTRTHTLSATTVYEDNEACIVLANNDAAKPRTKHIAIKWQHFKDQIKQGLIKVIKVDSSYNWADILTKPLTRYKHDSLRKMIMGW
jgi:hypothetical protein